ncbi:ABC transporter permease [Oceanobacillus jeddahense]|uniref:ABC transporter permease n=1 Tax=Oceanobacillus jeddahense TaxID=1462527 RepID=A0ABY5K0W9_9BACI|nr:ABC transporter permease [Oceanobacillus jeddahense]UUI05277.1 ABC transporter permease [Oceanobacillus jeddahense]
MIFLKQTGLFIKNHIRQLKRKWYSLPLLFIFPLLLTGLMMVIVVSFFSQDENEAIQLGLVDLDNSTETEMMVQLLEQSSGFIDFLEVHELPEEEAIEQIELNHLSTYIAFPSGFIQDLYQGHSVEVPIVGNRKQQLESYMINETLQSVIRHIRSSQANILTINYYAKQFQMDDEERNDFVFEQFQDFLMYTVGRDQVIKERTLSNQASSSPIAYFSLGSWFIISSLWLFSLYYFFTKENPPLLSQRIQLYGATLLRQLLAKIVVTCMLSLTLAYLSFFTLLHFLNVDLNQENIIRTLILIAIYQVGFIISLAIFEVLISSLKLRLLVQILFVSILILFSGAIIPTLYLPLGIQDYLSYSYAYNSLYWLQEIILSQRHYAEYTSSLLLIGVLIFVLLGLLSWKEKRNI